MRAVRQRTGLWVDGLFSQRLYFSHALGDKGRVGVASAGARIDRFLVCSGGDVETAQTAASARCFYCRDLLC